MQLSVLLIALAASTSAWLVSECDGEDQRDLKAGKCHKYFPGKQAKYQSNNNCRVTFYSRDDCTGAAWGSKSQNKCLALPGNGEIKSVFCNED